MRRRFIFQSVLSLSALLGAPVSWAGQKNKFLVFGYQENGVGHFGRYSLTTGEFLSLKVDPAKKLHEVFPDRGNSNVIFAPDKRGDSLVEIDISRMILRNRHALSDGERLYGHGVFDTSRRYLWLTGYRENFRGFLVQFDTVAKKFGRKLHLEGYYPHQIHRLSDGSMAVGLINDLSVLRSQICIVDAEAKKIRAKHVFSERKLGTIDHFTVVDRNKIIVPLTKEVRQGAGKKYYPAPLYQWKVGDPKGEFVALPASNKEESLTDTVVPFRKEFVLISNSRREELLLYNFVKRSFSSSLSLGRAPFGIAFLGTDILVNGNGFRLNLLRFSKGRLSLEKSKVLTPAQQQFEYRFEAHSYLV